MRHYHGSIMLIVSSLVIYVITLIFNGLAGAAVGPFKYSVGDVANKYDLDITPAGWTFSIWGLIYTALTAMLIYLSVNIFRRNEFFGYEGYWYYQPEILTKTWYIVFILNMVLNISWLLLWVHSYDNKWFLIPSLVSLVAIAATNSFLLFSCCLGLDRSREWLANRHPMDLWLYRILVENTLGLYFTWTVIATLFNVAYVLTYCARINQETSGTVALSFLLVLSLVWFTMETFWWNRYVQYLITPWLVIIWALIGSLNKNYKHPDPSRNNIYLAVLLGVVSVLAIVRYALLLFHHMKKPIEAML